MYIIPPFGVCYDKVIQRGFAPIYLLVGILILAVVSGIYYFSKPQAPKSQVPVVSRAPQTNQTPDDISNWKIYKSKNFSYEFQYPPSYAVEESFDSNGKIYSTIITNTENKLFSSGEKNIDDKDVFTMLIRNPSSELLPEWPDAQDSKISDYLISGQVGIKYGQNDVIVLHKDKEYAFHLLSINSQFKDNFDQILSSFKFID